MGSAFEQLAFLTFDGMVLNLMDELGRLQKPCLKGMLILNSFSFLSVSKKYY